jgi:hypothetical protein
MFTDTDVSDVPIAAISGVKIDNLSVSCGILASLDANQEPRDRIFMARRVPPTLLERMNSQFDLYWRDQWSLDSRSCVHCDW